MRAGAGRASGHRARISAKRCSVKDVAIFPAPPSRTAGSRPHGIRLDAVRREEYVRGLISWGRGNEPGRAYQRVFGRGGRLGSAEERDQKLARQRQRGQEPPCHAQDQPGSRLRLPGVRLGRGAGERAGEVLRERCQGGELGIHRALRRPRVLRRTPRLGPAQAERLLAGISGPAVTSHALRRRQ